MKRFYRNVVRTLALLTVLGLGYGLVGMALASAASAGAATKISGPSFPCC